MRDSPVFGRRWITKPYTIVERVRGEEASLEGEHGASIARGSGAHLGSLFGRFITFLREAAAARAGHNGLCVTPLDVLGTLLLKLGYTPTSITNMPWVKLLSDGSVMWIEETGGIDFAS